ncbi:MAG TPA: HAMP domain-containing sensor histidine kinase [Bacteroidales bacterium]|nr:HAMP domain-containing sensor histidine kinase [Bacteroidales bacterium]
MNRLSDDELIRELNDRINEKNQALEELRILNEKLITVNKKLEESEALKSHFVSNITNEIVNPFASILGLSKNILRVKKEDWQKVFSMVAMIHTEAFWLDFQLKNVFAAAKIEAGEVYPEIGKVDVSSVIKTVIDSFTIEAEKKKVVFDFHFDFPNQDEPVFFFRTDPGKLELIFSNLLNNALKFSYTNGRILIRVSYEMQQLFISVHDYGVNISQEFQQLIFDRFRRVDSTITSVNRGHGLGLSIISSLLDLLGGDINFQSDPEKGTTFIVNIPEGQDNADNFTSSLDGNEIFFEDQKF